MSRTPHRRRPIVLDPWRKRHYATPRLRSTGGTAGRPGDSTHGRHHLTLAPWPATAGRLRPRGGDPVALGGSPEFRCNGSPPFQGSALRAESLIGRLFLPLPPEPRNAARADKKKNPRLATESSPGRRGWRPADLRGWSSVYRRAALVSRVTYTLLTRGRTAFQPGVQHRQTAGLLPGSSTSMQENPGSGSSRGSLTASWAVLSLRRVSPRSLTKPGLRRKGELYPSPGVVCPVRIFGTDAGLRRTRERRGRAAVGELPRRLRGGLDEEVGFRPGDGCAGLEHGEAAGGTGARAMGR